jgi:nitrogen fixation/metabolism regulation signal transduction histidine kinase
MNRARTLATAVLVSAVVVLATFGVLLAVTRALPGATTMTTYLVGGAVATLVVFGVHRLVAGRLVFDGVGAVADGLLSLTEGDFGVRLASPPDDEVARLIARFNALAEKLRSERSGVYQKQMLLEAVLAASTSIAVITNEVGRIVYANPAAEQFFAAGKRIEGEPLQALLALAPKDVQDAASAERDTLFTCDRPGHDEPETFHLSKHPFELSTQRHTLFLLRPLTKELARKEVETWKKAIRVLSHEVGNSLAPVTSLVHSARLIAANPAGHEKRLAAALDTIEERATHLRTFLDGYASFARLPLPAPRAVPWKDLLAGVEGLYAFKVDGALPAAPLWADAAQLQQVLINLLKNAAESGSPPEAITLSARAAAGGVELVVADRGKGMAPDVLRSALLPFFSTKKTGSGLGLALCREIVEAHGGRLSLHPRDGGGLSVRCWLPAAPAA